MLRIVWRKASTPGPLVHERASGNREVRPRSSPESDRGRGYRVGRPTGHSRGAGNSRPMIRAGGPSSRPRVAPSEPPRRSPDRWTTRGRGPRPASDPDAHRVADERPLPTGPEIAHPIAAGVHAGRRSHVVSSAGIAEPPWRSCPGREPTVGASAHSASPGDQARSRGDPSRCPSSRGLKPTGWPCNSTSHRGRRFPTRFGQLGATWFIRPPAQCSTFSSDIRAVIRPFPVWTESSRRAEAAARGRGEVRAVDLMVKGDPDQRRTIGS